MPRAKSVCSEEGCLKTSEDRGKCRLHKRPAWQGSRRNIDRPSSWRTTRTSALRRDRRLCVLCGQAATEVDHIRPVALGGSWGLDNAQSLCSPCHLTKTLREAAERRARGA